MMLRRLFLDGIRPRASGPPPSTGAAEPTLRRHVEQAAAAFDAPIALVTLLRDDEQLMLAAVGMPFRCMPRQEGFCRYAVARGGLFEVCDASTDPRFATLPAVRGAPGIRYYLGASFGPTGPGDVGALCVVDVKPRRAASADGRAYMAALSRQVGALLEQRPPTDADLAA